MKKKVLDWCNEENFIVRLKAHESLAWEILFDNYSRELYGVIMARLSGTGMEAYADEIHSRTWNRSFASIDGFSDESPPCNIKPWIKKVAKNIIHEFRRSWIPEKNDVSYEEEPDDSTYSPLITTTDLPGPGIPERTVIEKENDVEMSALLEVVEVAIRETLSPRDQEILLRWKKGDQLSELAVDYSLTVSGVRKLLNRAFKKIKGYVEMKGGVYHE